MSKVIVSRKMSDLNIFEKIEHFIKRKVKRYLLDSRKNLIKDNYVQRSEYETVLISICRNAIKNPNSKIRVSPKTGHRVIRIPSESINIIIKDGLVDIVNHTYHYPNPICVKTQSIICNIFDGQAEKEVDEIIDEIHSNITHSLSTIKDRVKN